LKKIPLSHAKQHTNAPQTKAKQNPNHKQLRLTPKYKIPKPSNKKQQKTTPSSGNN